MNINFKIGDIIESKMRLPGKAKKVTIRWIITEVKRETVRVKKIKPGDPINGQTSLLGLESCIKRGHYKYYPKHIQDWKDKLK